MKDLSAISCTEFILIKAVHVEIQNKDKESIKLSEYLIKREIIIEG